jgi:hypothetical protein
LPLLFAKVFDILHLGHLSSFINPADCLHFSREYPTTSVNIHQLALRHH